MIINESIKIGKEVETKIKNKKIRVIEIRMLQTLFPSVGMRVIRCRFGKNRGMYTGMSENHLYELEIGLVAWTFFVNFWRIKK